MTTVSRHEVDPELARRQIADLAPRVGPLVENSGRDPSNLRTVYRWALEATQYRCVLDPDAGEPETWHGLRAAQQALSALFSMAAHAEGEIPVEIDGRSVRLTATGPFSLANAGNWLTALWLSLALRDRETVRWLCGLPLELMRASGAVHDDYMYPWVESLRAFLRRETVPPEMFTPAMAGTDPDAAHVTPPEVMLRLVYPSIKMFYHVLRRDGEALNSALEQALTLHREHWATDDRTQDPGGILALAPMGVAIIAGDVGLPVEVRSEYLPAGFLTGADPR
ncbi:immunity 49 family protein [Saccharomonospora halophila]|uniref:immunity 49 family protein n=1 Tax=Saccharomonospora halophila TaxID=129922 RepID=UPI00036DCE1E|nr:immunity 49 family protein [Saccharomonospora halophila]